MSNRFNTHEDVTTAMIELAGLVAAITVSTRLGMTTLEAANHVDNAIETTHPGTCNHLRDLIVSSVLILAAQDVKMTADHASDVNAIMNILRGI